MPGNVTLRKLHNILQVVMGWTNSHLHQFYVGEICFTEPDPDWEREVEDDRKFKLSRITATEGYKFRYEYDFGDSWIHEILVEKILLKEPGVKYPLCLTGKRACPPEDCGGVYGYADLLETIFDPKHEEHKSMLEWVGGEFHPETFDLDEVNRELRKIR